MKEKVARFRQFNSANPHTHHDAFEFPNGKILLVTRLVADQALTVLQLPVAAQQQRASVTSAQVAPTQAVVRR